MHDKTELVILITKHAKRFEVDNKYNKQYV